MLLPATTQTWCKNQQAVCRVWKALLTIMNLHMENDTANIENHLDIIRLNYVSQSQRYNRALAQPAKPNPTDVHNHAAESTGGSCSGRAYFADTIGLKIVVPFFSKLPLNLTTESSLSYLTAISSLLFQDRPQLHFVWLVIVWTWTYVCSIIMHYDTLINESNV